MGGVLLEVGQRPTHQVGFCLVLAQLIGRSEDKKDVILDSEESGLPSPADIAALVLREGVEDV